MKNYLRIALGLCLATSMGSAWADTEARWLVFMSYEYGKRSVDSNVCCDLTSTGIQLGAVGELSNEVFVDIDYRKGETERGGVEVFGETYFAGTFDYSSYMATIGYQFYAIEEGGKVYASIGRAGSLLDDGVSGLTYAGLGFRTSLGQEVYGDLGLIYPVSEDDAELIFRLRYVKSFESGFGIYLGFMFESGDSPLKLGSIGLSYSF